MPPERRAGAALDRLRRRLRPDDPVYNEAVVDRFLTARQVPLKEGRRAVFLYRGEADRVDLMHWVYGLDGRVEMFRMPGTDLWYTSLDLPEETRMEYKYAVHQNGDERWVRDPLNDNAASDPFGRNSVYQGPGYEDPDWATVDPRARSGELHDLPIKSRALRDERLVRVYVPARLRYTQRYPLLIVHDGFDYARYADLLTVLDNLIERQEIAPMVVALTQSPDRIREYAADPRHHRYLVRELLPRLEKEFPLEPDPSHRGLMGASFGAVAALSTAWRSPERFGRLLLQSGSFAFSDLGHHGRSEAFDPVATFMNAFRKKPGDFTQKAYVSCGIHESLIYENRSLIPVLQDAGVEVRYREARDGHNWQNWRDRLREGLSWLYPGPLWMVYE